MKFRLALAQSAPRLGDIDANLKQILDLTAQAQAQKADLVIFPELALTGYYLKDLTANVAVHPTPDDPHFAPLLAASRRLDLVIGFVEKDARHQYYIAAGYLSDGRVVHIHRKVYLPTYRLFDDARFFARGRAMRAFDTRFGRMGLMICEDAWHISTPYVLWMDGADFLIDIAASPGYGVPVQSGLSSAESVNAFLRAYTDLLTTYVFYCNRVGVEDGISFWGGSSVFDPEGRIVATAPQFEEHLTIAEIDADALRRARLKLPTLRDEERELVRRELERSAKEQSI
ncbi:MAG: carbon-nitrogen hydrolase [Chloroflexi bacterium]|nr:carbon-nitrogen hydrolase [Chloroflexota bacterium]